MMAKKSEMISVSSVDKIIDNNKERETVIEWGGNELHIKDCVSLGAFSVITDSVAECCFDKDSGDFMPWMRWFAESIAIVSAYTNIRIPTNNEKQYELLLYTDILDLIEENANQLQLKELHDAISRKISYTISVQKSSYERLISETTMRLNSIGDALASMFNGVNNDDIISLVKAIGNGQISEEKIVESIMGVREKASGEEDHEHDTE